MPDVLVAAPQGVTLLADVYVPTHALAPPPLIVWLHGGGWQVGDRRLGPDFGRYFAASGFAMASVEYRLSPEATFPAQIEDVKTAIRWARSSAREYGWNPEQIGLWGSSAGAHLAALAATSGPGLFEPAHAAHVGVSSAIKAVVAGYPPVDFLQMDPQRDPAVRAEDDPESVRLAPGARSTDADSPESRLLGSPIAREPDLARLASPLTYVSSGCPATLLVHGRSDAAVPWRQSELLYLALAAAGNDVTLVLVEQLGHGFFNRTHLDDGPPWIWRERHSVGGATRETDRRGRLFDRVETFFRHHLGAPMLAGAPP